MRTGEQTSFFYYPNSYLLVWDEDAKSIRASKLVQVARAVGAIVELVGRVGAVFLPVTHVAYRHTARMTRVPGRAGKLGGTAGTFTCRR